MNRVRQIAGNELMLLKNGMMFFPQLCADIDGAKRSVYLETYIFAADTTGVMVAQALQRAAARGVTVRLLLDGFGSAELPDAFVDGLRAEGVEVQWFRREISPFTLRRDRMRRLRRMHRKMAAIDSNIAYVGGINIIDDIPAELGSDAPRLDYTVRIRGGLPREVQVVMRRLWELVSWAAFRKRIRAEGLHLRLPRKKKAADCALQLVLRDNVRHRRDIERAYMQAIAGAQHEVVIANAYFLPGRLFRRTLTKAALRGVRVVLLLQGKVEYRLQHYATLALYDKLIGAGVEIYEYQPSFLHAKVAVVDGEWATVGSFNIDPFSLLLAREANLVIRDKEFAAVLRDDLWNAIEKDALRVELASRSMFTRILTRGSYLLIRFIIGVLGLSKKH